MPLHWHSPDYIIDVWGCVFREANHEWWTSVHDTVFVVITLQCIPLEGSIVPYAVSLVTAENLS